MVLVVLLPGLDALQDKREVEEKMAQEPAWSLRVCGYGPLLRYQDSIEGCSLHNVDKHWKGQVKEQCEHITAELKSNVRSWVRKKQGCFLEHGQLSSVYTIEENDTVSQATTNCQQSLRGSGALCVPCS